MICVPCSFAKIIETIMFCCIIKCFSPVFICCLRLICEQTLSFTDKYCLKCLLKMNKKFSPHLQPKLIDYFLRMRDSYTNPYESKRIESFEIFGLTKRIHNTNLLKKGLRIESTIRILKVRIRESKSSGFVRIWIRESLFLRIRFVP
jgi:hypothetical protein